ncbi:MAG: hypothetical protein AB1483_02505 [Candidatus Zixiibacteriota bacterium]
MRGKQSANRIGGWRLFAPLIAICVLVLVLALPGCSDKVAEVNSSEDQVNFFDLPFDEEALAKRSSLYEAVYWTWDRILVDEGGVIDVPGGQGAFSFEIEANSFPMDTVFEIRVCVVESDVASPVILYEFCPDGLVFSKPARLVLDADVVASFGQQFVDFYYLLGNKWVYQGTYYADEEGVIAIDVHHFSKYGTGGPSTR